MSEPSVILQVLPRLESGGVERGTVEITDAIHKAEMKPLVASRGGALLTHIRHAGGEHITLPLDSKNPFVMWQNARQLYRLIQERNVRIIHARSRAPAWSAYFAARKANIPFLTTFHGIYSLEGKFKKHYNSVMVKGARVIAVSDFVRAHILAHYAVDPQQIRTIPRGVDFNLFDEARILPDRIHQLTKNWMIHDQFVPIIFCPGRISRIKGQHVLIEALAQLTDVPFLCIIAGTDQGHEEYRDRLHALIRTRGLEGKVRITGSTNYMTEAYTLSSLVVVPSTQPESFGRVAIEAQAMGKLVIATDHGGARETIVSNETGYLVPPGNATILAEAIRFALARDTETTDAMAAYAKQSVREHFSSDRMKEATIAVYRELLG